MPRFFSRKVEYDGRKFDSKLECERYKFLRIMEQEGLIQHLTCQKPFTLIEAFRSKLDRHIRATVYNADFVYWNVQLDVWIVEDTKGKTWSKKKNKFIGNVDPVYTLKKKMLQRMLVMDPAYKDFYFYEVYTHDEAIRTAQETNRSLRAERRT